MNAIRKQGVLLLVVVSLFVWVSTASADPISVVNASFETVASSTTRYDCGGSILLTQCWYSENQGIYGWTPSANFKGGQFQPFYAGGFSAVPDGNMTLWSIGGYHENPGTLQQKWVPGYLEQTVGAVVVAGVTYTLQVDVGRRLDKQEANAAPQLMIGDTPYFATGVAPGVGEWKTWSVSYTGTDEDAGAQISIRLEAFGAQPGFDNVRLDNNLQQTVTHATPEPATLVLLATGLLGAAFRKFLQ